MSFQIHQNTFLGEILSKDRVQKLQETCMHEQKCHPQ